MMGNRRARLRPVFSLVLAAAVLAAPSLVPAGAHSGDPGTPSSELALVGSSSLGGGGLNGEVAVVGRTAVVATGVHPGSGVISGLYNPYPCPQTKVKLVDLHRPATPKRVGNILIRAGVLVQDVAAIEVSTPAFTGKLAALALAICASSGDHHGSSGAFEDRGVAYYDISDPASPVLLGRYKADLAEFPSSVEKCGRPPQGRGPEDPTKGPDACASSQHSVSLFQRADGRVLSISTEPFATASGCFGDPRPDTPPCFAGDLRIVDVTDPRNPVQLASYPSSRPADYPTQGLTSRPSGFSANGCRPFSAGRAAELHAGGTKAALAFLDDGLHNVDLTDPSSPTLIARTDPYPPSDRFTEGNGSFATVGGASGNLALLSDSDFIAPDTSLRIDSPATSPQGLTAGSKFGCEAMFTLFDPENTAQIYRHAGSQVPAGAGSSAAIVYVGRGCPINESFGTFTPDPYLTEAAGNPVNPAGKIAVVDRFATPNQIRIHPDTQDLDPNSQVKNFGSGCSIAEKAKRAQGNGAIGVVIDASFANRAFSPDGDPAGLSIPVMALDRPAATQVRTTLCPGTTIPANGQCTPGTPVTGAMVDGPGSWGGLRIIDLTTNTQVGTYSTPRSGIFPPPDLGIYSVHHAVTRGNRAYVAAHSDGLRVLDLSNPASPVEVAHFVPPDTPDPLGVLPAKAYVVGVAIAGCNVLVTDIHSGLYVLADPALCP